MEDVVRKTIDERPVGATHWSTRTLAPKVRQRQIAEARIRARPLGPGRRQHLRTDIETNYIEAPSSEFAPNPARAASRIEHGRGAKR